MFFRKAVFLLSFFIITPTLLITSTVFYAYRYYQINQSQEFTSLNQNTNPNVYFAALPSIQQEFASSIVTGDARVEKVRAFFRDYGSILANYSDLLVEKADEYGLDYRLLPAIAM